MKSDSIDALGTHSLARSVSFQYRCLLPRLAFPVVLAAIEAVSDVHHTLQAPTWPLLVDH